MFENQLKHLKIKDIKTKYVKAFLKIIKPWVKQDVFGNLCKNLITVYVAKIVLNKNIITLTTNT